MDRYCTKCGKITHKKNDSLYVCVADHENWINPATGVGAFVIKNGKVLFGVRSREPGKGKLDIPGGFVEVHESAEQAVIREAKEEFGIDINLQICFRPTRVYMTAGRLLTSYLSQQWPISISFRPTI